MSHLYPVNNSEKSGSHRVKNIFYSGMESGLLFV